MENPISVIIDVDLSDVDISKIGGDMAESQKKKVQEVFAPVLLTQVVSMTTFRRRF